MPTFNQSKPDDEGEPAARQLTAEDRELMLKTGLPPEVADAYMAGGTFTCVDEAVKHYRAQAEAAPAPAPPEPPRQNEPGFFTLAFEGGRKILVATGDRRTFADAVWKGTGSISTVGGPSAAEPNATHWPQWLSLRDLREFYPTIQGEFDGVPQREFKRGIRVDDLLQHNGTFPLPGVLGFLVLAVLEPDRRPRLAMPIRRSETAVERDSAGDITRSVTVEQDA